MVFPLNNDQVLYDFTILRKKNAEREMTRKILGGSNPKY